MCIRDGYVLFQINDSITRQYDHITQKIGKKLKGVEHLSLSILVCYVLDRSFLVVVAHFICELNSLFL